MANYNLDIDNIRYERNSPFTIWVGNGYVEDITNNVVIWTYSGNGTFLGLSKTGYGETVPDIEPLSSESITKTFTHFYRVVNVPTRKWLLNQNITDLVPDGSDYQQLHFNYNCYVTTEEASGMCTLVAMGVMSPFSTWQQFVTQLPSALESLGLTDVSSTFDASNVPTDFKSKLNAVECEFVGNEDDGYWFAPNLGFTNIEEGPNITGTISLTYEGNSYTLTFGELNTAMAEVFGTPLFDVTANYDINSGYSFDFFRTWEITGGKDADDAVFYNWLQNNAIEIVGPQYISSIDISNKNYLFKDNELRLALEEFIDLLPVPTIADSGKYLGVDSTGHLALISPTPPQDTL